MKNSHIKPTGELGQTGKDLMVSYSEKEKRVRIDFAIPVQFVTMSVDQAFLLAGHIIKAARCAGKITI